MPVAFVTSYTAPGSGTGTVIQHSAIVTGSAPALVLNVGRIGTITALSARFGPTEMTTAGQVGTTILEKTFFLLNPTPGTNNVCARFSGSLSNSGVIQTVLLNSVTAGGNAINGYNSSTGAAATQASAQVASTANEVVVDAVYSQQVALAATSVPAGNGQTIRRENHAAGVDDEGQLSTSTKTGETSTRMARARVCGAWSMAAVRIGSIDGGGEPPAAAPLWTCPVLGAD